MNDLIQIDNKQITSDLSKYPINNKHLANIRDGPDEVIQIIASPVI